MKSGCNIKADEGLRLAERLLRASSAEAAKGRLCNPNKTKEETSSTLTEADGFGILFGKERLRHETTF